MVGSRVVLGHVDIMLLLLLLLLLLLVVVVVVSGGGDFPILVFLACSRNLFFVGVSRVILKSDFSSHCEATW